ncbi:MAG: tRNA (adenosine(37)-N6)-dimethylallyltransferase MiaA [Anaerolineaceae bacterium]|nr:tRNA (adenosine(37)-N6)-dimethylallyltransferase MiaA [Anaerolineaceae bacterium]
MSLIEAVIPLVVIIGPTAVGKTELAINLAERLGGEIISADSRLFYMGMNIGTAKPSPEDLSRVRHHLIDVTSPTEPWSLARFQSEARRAVEEIYGRGKLPFLVGGTGQYVRAVIEGWEMPPQSPDPALRQVLVEWAEEIGPFNLHEKLAALDPEAASLIDARNVRRTVRALEVIFWTGRAFSAQRRQEGCPYRLLMIGLTRPRTELYARIDQRIDRMIADGFIQEVQGLLAAGFNPQLPALSAIGYHEITSYLQGEIDQQEAVRLIKRKTRNFVRRQANWFKPDDPWIRWFVMKEGVTEEAALYIQSEGGWILPRRIQKAGE